MAVSSARRCGRAETGQFNGAPGERMTAAKRERWSQRVSQGSNALDRKAGVFTRQDPRAMMGGRARRRSEAGEEARGARVGGPRRRRKARTGSCRA